jgi:hypothetical protein
MTLAVDEYVFLPALDKPTAIAINGNSLLFSAFLTGATPTPAKLWKYDWPSEAFVDSEPIYRVYDWGIASAADRTLVIASATNPISGVPFDTPTCMIHRTSDLAFLADVSVTPIAASLPQYFGQDWEFYPSYSHDGFGKVFGLLHSPYASSPGGNVNPPYVIGVPVAIGSSGGQWYYEDPWDVAFVDFTPAPTPGLVGYFAVKQAVGNYCLPNSVLNPTGQGLIGNGFLDGGLYGIDVVPNFNGTWAAWVTGWVKTTANIGTTYNYLAKVTLNPYQLGAFGTVTVNAIRINAGNPVYSTPRYASGNVYVMAQMPQWSLNPPVGITPTRYNATTLAPNNPVWGPTAYAGTYKLTDVTPSFGNTYILTVTDSTLFGLTSTTGIYIVDGGTDQIVDGGTIPTFAGGETAIDSDFNVWVNTTGWALADERIAKMNSLSGDGWSFGILGF